MNVNSALFEIGFKQTLGQFQEYIFEAIQNE